MAGFPYYSPRRVRKRRFPAGKIQASSFSGTAIASHSFSHPGKFHVLGKPRHCRGFTSWMRHRSPSSMTHSVVPSLSLSDKPVRLPLILVNFSMKSGSGTPRKDAIPVISASFIRTSPGHLQHAVQRWQTKWYRGLRGTNIKSQVETTRSRKLWLLLTGNNPGEIEEDYLLT